MKFYGREDEIKSLRREDELSLRTARFTVVTGRRRIGKTELISQALARTDGTYLYLLLVRQGEKSLCAALQRSIEEQLGPKIAIYGKAERLIDLMKVVFELAKETRLTVVIDEFQEMDYINSAFYGDLQGLWDRVHTTYKIHLVVSGSVNRMMNKILFSYSEPLYGRCTTHFKIRPFPVSVLKQILRDAHPKFKATDLLDLWAITGGVAKYVKLLIDARAYTRTKMLETVFALNSPFFDEGRASLVQEFGPVHANYFSILSSIALGHTRLSEIEQDAGMQVTSYLGNLEKNYELVKKVLPIFAAPSVKNSAYRIEDMFFRFWFRYVYRNQDYIELGRYEALRAKVARDFDTFCGFALERYFFWKFVEEAGYTRMGGWWDRKGENEIDLVCEDELSNRLDIYEVKRDPARYDALALRKKVDRFLEKNPEKSSRQLSLRCLSLEDM